ncbi:hypothetical protein HYPSUDRAFT_74780 [Hypholoma sublateritium FD-334 SS-4]|uniref:Uncharacterized protein n=1 Tax=Hypholoma sublateritium (strain FD-334 SS-4) TaxID=945553 RepID=A0A0D2Q801_HYPSF|nr:hypothetical protein HYPSUDRAFT_74780 [Hypholoma sublateritium FD-334 SS-4]
MVGLSVTDRSTNQTTHNVVNLPTVPAFSSFQFKTIGKPPDLLKRMTIPADTDMNVDECYDKEISMSSDGNLDTDNMLFELYETKPDVNKQRSLRERLAMKEDDVDKNIVDTHMESEFPPANIFAEIPAPTNESTPRHASGCSIIHTPNPSPLSGKIHHPGGDNTQTVSSIKQPGSVLESLAYNGSRSKIADGRNSLQSSGSEVRAPFEALSPSRQTVTEAPEAPTFTAFRDLQIQLATSLANLNPITTSDARAIAQSVNDRYAEVTASAKHAYMLAQKALSAAEESMGAAKECLNHAEALQSRTDDVLDAVAKIDNDGQKQLWNDALQTLKNGLHDLDRWGRQMECQRQREFDEMDMERRKHTAATQSVAGPSGSGPPSASAVVQAPSYITSSATVRALSESILKTLEHEAVAATEAWNRQITEQDAERRRIAAEELRKRRAIEAQAERQNGQAAAAFVAARAERIAAEEEEKVRQEEEGVERERRLKELESKREAVALQKASEERVAAEIEEEKQAFRKLQQEEEKRKDLVERGLLLKKLEVEKAQARARDAQANEKNRQQQMREQELKRKEIATQKQRAASDEAKRIQSDRARSKQSAQNNTPPNQSVVLPAVPISACEALLHVEPPTHPNVVHDVDIRSSVKNQVEKADQEGASSGSLLSRIGASATSSSQPDSQNPPQLENLSSSLLGRPAPEILPNGRSPPIITPTQSILGKPMSVSTNGVPDIPPTAPAQARSRVDPIPSINPAQSHFARENIASGISRGEAAAAIHKEQRPPSLGVLPTIHRNSLDTQTDNHPKLSVPNGQDLGNITLIPCSQAPPISAAAQKDNLRHIAKGSQAGIKVEHDDNMPFVKVERNPTPPISSVMHASSQNDAIANSAHIQHPPTNGGGIVSSIRVPMLSLPLPIAPRTTPSTGNLPINRLAADAEVHRQRSSGPRPVEMNTIQGSGLRGTQSTSHILPCRINTNQSDIAPKQGATIEPRLFTESSSSDTTPLPSSHGIPRVSELVECFGSDPSRMGPDAVEDDGWARATQDNMYVPAIAHRQARERTPPRQARQHDHWSPPAAALPGSGSHFQQRNRPLLHVDHYSPSRSPSPQLSYASYPKQRPRWSRSLSRGQGDSNNSRAVTPEQPMYQVQASHHQPLPLNRKRPYVGNQINEPPNRRPRYEAQLREAEPSYITTPQADWSHVAEYSRSPTPEVPRATPLQMRLGEETDRAPNYRHNQGLPNRQRAEPQYYNRPAAAQGPAYHPQSSNNHAPRLNPRQTTDSRLPLLDRFSVQAPLHSLTQNHNHVHHASTTRGTNRGRGRGAHQPLGNRIAKGALIDRLAAERQPDNNDE